MLKRNYKVVILVIGILIIITIIGLIYYFQQYNSSNETANVDTYTESDQSEEIEKLDIDLNFTDEEWILLYGDFKGPFDAYNFDGKKTASIDASGNGVIKLSPDRKKVIYNAVGNDLWFYNLSSKKETQITEVGTDSYNLYEPVGVTPSVWSPDSQGFLYTVGSVDQSYRNLDKPLSKNPSVKFGLYYFNLHTQENRYLTSNTGNYFWPSGFKNPLFKEYPKPEIYELNLDNGQVNQIAKVPSNEIVDKVSFYRKDRLLWIDRSTENINNSQVLMSNFSGSEKVVISKDTEWRYSLALFSPNGKRLVYTKQKGGTHDSTELVTNINIYDVETKETKTIIEAFATSTRWLNNSTILVQESKDIKKRTIDLYTLNVNTGEKQYIIQNKALTLL